MGEDHVQTKQRLRRTLRALPHEADAAERAASARACERIVARPEFAAARDVVVYVALPGEPDPTPLATRARTAGKTVYYPRETADGLEFVAAEPATFRPSPRGVAEPVAGAPLRGDAGVLFVVPGLAFDPEGTRLGRGGGHYDRALARWPRATCFGLAFESRVLARLPRDPWDVRMHAVATESRWIAPATTPVNEDVRET